MLKKLFSKLNVVSSNRGMKIIAVPAYPDNLMYVIIDDTSTKECAVVDPRVVKNLESEVKKHPGIKVTAAFITHHHLDHCAEANRVRPTFGDHVKVYGNDSTRIDGQTHKTENEGTFSLGDLKVQTFHTPGHTNSHCCYFVTDPKTGERAVFTGDTLFIAGCGRLFEGTPQQMDNSLNKVLGNLPNDTKVYCGHEYTVSNLQFAQSVEPDNMAIMKKRQWAQEKRGANEWTVPSTIEEEKSFNPFMRVREPSLQKITGQTDPVDVLRVLREMKNNFVPPKL
uniref:Metallo-beta-lactamase domain-containing protein n=1 Tax=Panagrolaimus sp. JU765 TaxID=591449 RepID=A0AC34Q1T7_9BILA